MWFDQVPTIQVPQDNGQAMVALKQRKRDKKKELVIKKTLSGSHSGDVLKLGLNILPTLNDLDSLQRHHRQTYSRYELLIGGLQKRKIMDPTNEWLDT